MKIFISIFLSIFLTSSVYATNTKTYTGTITPILQCVYKAGTNYPFMGLINKVPRIGEIVTPPVLSPEGKIIKPGSILVQSQLTYHTASMLAAKNRLKALKYELKTDTENYDRYKTLSKTSTVSLQTFDAKEAQYFSAKGGYETAQANLMEEQAVLKAMTDIAPFEAIITNVFRPIGCFMNEHEIVEFSQLNPIAVTVKMSNEDARKITPSTVVKVYPLGSDRPYGIFHGFGQRVDEGYQFSLCNKPQYSSFVSVAGKKVPVIEKVETVFPFCFINKNKSLSVPLKSIYKNNNGYYVWKGVGVKNMQPGKGLKEVFPVKKVYVKPGNYKRNQAGYTIYQILDDPGSLEKYDVIIVEPPQGLKDNDLVCYPKNNYIFMPGDSVKVEITEQ